MKNFLIALIVVVVLGGAYYLLQSSPATPEGDTSAIMEEEGAAGDTSATGDAMMEEGDSTMEPGQGEDEFDALISYTSAGYEPSSVTIKKGETVRFVNSSSEGTWPASAVHPTHGVYPEKSESDCLGSSFDACRQLQPAEFWEFTFNEVGEWRYHDHMHPSKTGVVIVTE